MENYLTVNSANSSTPSYNLDSYLPKDANYITDYGEVEEEGTPILSGGDNIFSELCITGDNSNAYHKASDFIDEFTKIFVKEKTPDRAYSKFVQNKNELPDVELDWIFQYFRVSFIFSNNDEDYYCVTKYDEKTGKYDSTTGPLKRGDYKAVAEDVMQKIR